jgi:hypothetical protein
MALFKVTRDSRRLIMFSIRSLIEDTQSGGDFYLLLGNFLDEFNRSDAVTRQRMLLDEPAAEGQQIPHEIVCFAAATAHKLANDHGLQVPAWVFKKDYYLTDKPFFEGNVQGRLRLLFMYTSPTEFKHRNLFVDENVLVRV